MSIETWFLMICNNLDEDFDPKNHTFWIFGGAEGKKMVIGVWIDGFCTKTINSAWVNSYLAWLKLRTGALVNLVGRQFYEKKVGRIIST